MTAIESQAPAFEQPSTPEIQQPIIAIKTDGRKNAKPTIDSGGSASDLATNDADDESKFRDSHQPKGKKKSRFAIVSGGSIAVLLIASLLIFLLRSPPELKSKEKLEARVNQAVVSESAKEPRPIARGTLARLAAEIPPPLTSQSETDKPDLSPRTVTPVSKTVSSEDTAVPTQPSPFGGQTVAPAFSLPQPMAARPRIPIISPQRSGRFFDNAYERAYQSYEAWSELGDDKSDTDEYSQLLGETLGKVKLAHEATLLQGDASKQTELAYLLTFLSHKAGHLIEAIVYGQTVARLGEAEDDATRDAAFITLAACQEASSTHWASPTEVGELHQMQMIAELIDTKWPDEPQRDAIWFSLAKSYAAFGHHDQAISAYTKIDEESSLFSDASLGLGVAYWTMFLNAASKPNANSDDMLQLLAKASSQFQRCVTTMERELDKPTMPLFSAKQMLAVIADRTSDRKAVLRWTTEGKFPMLDSIRVTKKPQPGTILVSIPFAQNIFELVHQARKDTGDIEGATEILTKLEALLGDRGGDDLGSMQSATLIARFKELLGQGNIAMSDVKSLDKLIATTSSKPSTSDDAMQWLWIAQSWASLGEQSNNSNVTKTCYERAVAICQELLGSKLVPQSHLTSTWLRQTQWLRLSGNPEASLDVLDEILRATPNVLHLQMQAALTLEERAIEGDSESQLRQAISGMSDESAFWGWAKLAVNLHRLRYSEKGTQQHAQSLLQSHFHLARCRWMLSSVLAPGSERETLQKQTLKQLGTARLAIAGTDPHADQWREVFETLATKVTSAED